MLMPAFINLTNQKFGGLTVLRRTTNSLTNPHPHWLCLCVCGNNTVATSPNLKNGKHKSCGCLKETQNGLTRKHPLWTRWNTMLSRCRYKSHDGYHNYGARGIYVCERWQAFPNFLTDMESSFFAGATLDRINNNGPYAPENCRWATQKQQCRNTRYNRIVETQLGKMTIAELAERTGIQKDTLRSRIDNGWPQHQWFDPVRQRT